MFISFLSYSTFLDLITLLVHNESSRLITRIAGSNPDNGMDVRVLFTLCVV